MKATAKAVFLGESRSEFEGDNGVVKMMTVSFQDPQEMGVVLTANVVGNDTLKEKLANLKPYTEVFVQFNVKMNKKGFKDWSLIDVTNTPKQK